METQQKCKRDAILNERELEYLKALYDYRYLTASLFKRLFNENSLRTVQHRLHQLWIKNIIRRIRLPHLIGEGSPELIYALNSNGFNVIKVDLSNSEKADKNISTPPKGISHLRHLLSVNFFLISLEVSSIQLEVDILEIRTYYSQPYILECNSADDSSDNNTIIPDTMFILSRNGKKALFFLEVDRDTEPIISFSNKKRSNFFQKVGIYSKILEDGNFPKFVNFKGFRVLIITPNTQRYESLRNIVSGLFGDTCFWFATENDINGKNILTDSIWQLPNESTNNFRALLKI